MQTLRRDPAGHGRGVRSLKPTRPASTGATRPSRSRSGGPARRGIRLQIQFTLPVEPTGLGSAGLSVLRNAIADGVRVYSVNIMVFDYYLPHEGVMNMSQTAITLRECRACRTGQAVSAAELAADLADGGHDDAAGHL